MIRMRFSALLGTALVVALAGCSNSTSDNTGGNNPPDLTGTWTVTKYEFVSVANPTTKVDVIATGYTGSVVLSDAAKTWSVTIYSGSDIVIQQGGTYTETANTITFS
ncbi:MAG: hypothetical protein ACREL5_12165, partial [Gemmatimonadales bacterium]